jgi:hypothetical protein
MSYFSKQSQTVFNKIFISVMIVKNIVTACNKHSNTQKFAYSNSKYYVNKENSGIVIWQFPTKTLSSAELHSQPSFAEHRCHRFMCA